MSGNKVSLDNLANQEGVRAKVSLESREDPEEMQMRLHKEKYSFWIKDAAPFLVAILILASAALACFVVLVRPSSTTADRDLAWKTFNLIIGAILGALFGKAASK